MIFLPFCFERKSASRLMALRKHQKHPENPFLIFSTCLNFPQSVSGSKRLNLSPKNCTVYSPPIMDSRAFRKGAIGDVVPHGSNLDSF
ncbi:hypothetical protein YC2023_033416 [Brassica napus]